jgi:hypothetical protein
VLFVAGMAFAGARIGRSKRSVITASNCRMPPIFELT